MCSGVLCWCCVVVGLLRDVVLCCIVKTCRVLCCVVLCVVLL